MPASIGLNIFSNRWTIKAKSTNFKSQDKTLIFCIERQAQDTSSSIVVQSVFIYIINDIFYLEQNHHNLKSKLKANRSKSRSRWFEMNVSRACIFIRFNQRLTGHHESLNDAS